MSAEDEVKIEIIESPNWRHGAPINPKIPKRLVVITTPYRYCLSDEQYFNLKKAFHEADLENIKNLENAEIPFIIKDLLKTTELLNGNFPRKFVSLLRQAIIRLIDKNTQI